MLISRRNQLLLEFSFWNEPLPRPGPNIYEMRTYHLKVCTSVVLLTNTSGSWKCTFWNLAVKSHSKNVLTLSDAQLSNALHFHIVIFNVYIVFSTTLCFCASFFMTPLTNSRCCSTLILTTHGSTDAVVIQI